MGAWEQDPNFEDMFGEGDRFVVTRMQYVGSINTSFGQAEKTLITVVTRDSYPKQLTYSALGRGFANMAQRATQSDFPAVAEFVRIPLPGNKAVKTLARIDVSPADWKNGEDGPPVDLAALTPKGSAGGTVGGTDSNPGF